MRILPERVIGMISAWIGLIAALAWAVAEIKQSRTGIYYFEQNNVAIAIFLVCFVISAICFSIERKEVK